MTRLFLTLFLLLQGIPTQQGGKVTGVLRDSLGMPIAGVRIAAVARGASVDEIAENGTAMAALAETDDQGRFTLESIPSGRYSIAAGRLDLQTYFPGTQVLEDARILTVAAGETIADINFTLHDTSFGRTPNGLISSLQASIPVVVAVEGGGKLPVSANGKLITVRLESTSTLQTIPIGGRAVFLVPGPVATDFRVSVENLPQTYTVKSMAYGTATIPQGIFHLSAANFPMVAPIPAAATTPLSVTLLNAVTALTSFTGPLVRLPVTPPSTISITLGEVERPAGGGVRVSGSAGKDNRRVYISGKPGMVFSDGTFEFRDVPPGRHLIAST